MIDTATTDLGRREEAARAIARQALQSIDFAGEGWTVFVLADGTTYEWTSPDSGWNRTTALTVANIEAGYTNDAWQGFGYLGGRRNAIEAVRSGEWESANVTAADAAALAVANRKGWTAARFFEWLNSKNGRWYADATIGSDTDDIAKVADGLVR